MLVDVVKGGAEIEMGSKRLKRLFGFIGLILLFIVAEMVVSYFVLPVANYGIAVIASRNEHNGQIDTVLLGASMTGNGIDPAVLDEQLGSASFNMATNAQTMRMSYYALRDAIATNDIKRAVIEISINRMSRDVQEDEGVTKVVFIDYLTDPATKLAYAWDNYSLNDIPQLLLSSVRCQLRFAVNGIGYKLDWDYLKHYAAHGYALAPINPGLPKDQGYVAFTDRIKRGGGGMDAPTPASATEVYATDESKTNLEELMKLVALCREHDIQVTFVTVPCADTWLLGYADSYQQAHDHFAKISAELGVPYFDFNYSKQLRTELRDRSFRDPKHLNDSGAQLFTAQLVRALNGELSAADFHADYAQATASIQRVAGMILRRARRPDNAAVASSRQPEGIVPEYRFFAKKTGADNAEYQLLQDYSADNRCELSSLSPGRYTLRAESRAAGVSTAEYDAYANLDVTVR